MLYENGEHAVGGGVVESFGLGGKGAKLPKGEHAIKEDTTAEVEPVYFCPLSFMAGTSSAAPYVKITNPTEARLLGGEVVPVWHPANLNSKSNGYTLLADGGSSDNTGVLPLVRRGVKHIIAVLDVVGSPTDPNALKTCWWPALFGRACVGVGASSPVNLNKRCQIFDENTMDELVNKADGCRDSGEPVVVEQDLEVLPNVRCGVQGGYTVHMLWIYNAISDSFKKELPQETQDLLNKAPPVWKKNPVLDSILIMAENEDLDARFPYSTTYFGNYSKRLCRMHSEMMAYNVMHAEEKGRFKTMFEKRYK